MSIEKYAAQLEADQAHRDFMEAYRAYMDDPIWGSKNDYVAWSLAGYAEAAGRVADSIPAKRQRRKGAAYWINMNDGIKGKRSTASSSVRLGKDLKR